jgi:hypothetical protein
MDLGAMKSITEAYNTYLGSVASNLGISVESIAILMALVSIWVLVWKGLALWKAVKNKSIIWFILLLVINDLGILEILYLFIFSKMGLKKEIKIPGRAIKKR